jgi:hypothetical protein
MFIFTNWPVTNTKAFSQNNTSRGDVTPRLPRLQYWTSEGVATGELMLYYNDVLLESQTQSDILSEVVLLKPDSCSKLI